MTVASTPSPIAAMDESAALAGPAEEPTGASSRWRSHGATRALAVGQEVLLDLLIGPSGPGC
jgi:hypothetical protein